MSLSFGSIVQELGLHIEYVISPFKHVDFPGIVYPLGQVCVHDLPLARLSRLCLQVPGSLIFPVVALSETRCGLGVQLLGLHVDGVKTPKEHDVFPESLYPGLHAGVHVEPLASSDVQSPTPP